MNNNTFSKYIGKKPTIKHKTKDNNSKYNNKEPKPKTPPNVKKNPAYGRQRFSPPMRIVAPLQENI